MSAINHLALSGDWELDYYLVLDRLRRYGHQRSSRLGTVLELSPVTLDVKNPPYWVEVEGRGGKRDFARIEQLCYLAGVNPDPLLRVAPRFDRFREANGTWYGSYGPRLRYQLVWVCRELLRHPDSRRAVIALWEARDLWGASLDQYRNVPCTTTLTFFRDFRGGLGVHATMRSCDAWFGLYYDLPAFSMLRDMVARAVGLPPGSTWLTITSLHLYERHWEMAAGVVPRRIGKIVDLPGELDRARLRVAGMTGFQVWAREALQK